MKSLLMQTFPQLIFHQPPRRNISLLVFTDTFTAKTVASQCASGSSDSSESETSAAEVSDCDIGTDAGPSSAGPSSSRTTRQSNAVPISGREIDADIVRIIYNAGMFLKAEVNESPGLLCPWPPLASDLGLSAVKGLVPVALYNFLAWVVGASDEPAIEDFVRLPEDVELKIFSLCQDIILLASKGKKQTPKSLCLGMTIRHLTGSSQLLNVMNKFGHCASRETVVRYETSIAELQIQQSANSIPAGFSRHVPTTIVWDNIDFGQETQTGKGTTHHTNGLLVQNAQYQVNVVDDCTARVSMKKGSRSLKSCPIGNIEYYTRKERHGPQNLGFLLGNQTKRQNYEAVIKDMAQTEMAFICCRFVDRGLHLIPGWTGFHITLQADKVLNKSNIHYLPVVDASPTELTTIYTIMKKSLDLADVLDLGNMVIVCDQAIYAKVQEIRWSNNELMNRLVVRMGEFHTCMAFMAVIGKRFSDAGLRDVVVEAQVIAEGSMNGFISGHHYNRSIWCHKLLSESLHRIRFQRFLDSLCDEEATRILGVINDTHSSFLSGSLNISADLDAILSVYDKFVEEQRKFHPTFDFWTSYLEMVTILLLFIRATRESNWELHLAATRSMLPWFRTIEYIMPDI